jgi:hypothetical protein
LSPVGRGQLVQAGVGRIGRLAGDLRSAGNRAGRGQPVRGPQKRLPCWSGHREPEHLAGGVAAADRPGQRALRASHGAALGRAGRVHISRDDADAIWVAGGTVTCVSGQVGL